MAVAWWLTSSLEAGWLRMGLKIAIAVLLYVGLLWLSGAKILRESVAYVREKRVKSREERGKSRDKE